MTSFHLRLGKKGGSQRARPSARRQRAGAPASCSRTSSLPPQEQRAAGDQAAPLQAPDSQTSGLVARHDPAGATACLRLGLSHPCAGTNGCCCHYLQGKAPPCRAAPTAPRWATASYCDCSPSQWLARQIPCPRGSSPPEPGLRLRRCHGVSFLPAPSHGPRQETTAARPELTQSANASVAPSSLPPRPNCRGRCATPPFNTARGTPPHCTQPRCSRTRLAERLRTTLRCARRRRPSLLGRKMRQQGALPLLGSVSPPPRLLAETNLVNPAHQTARRSASFPLGSAPRLGSPLCFHPTGEGAGRSWAAWYAQLRLVPATELTELTAPHPAQPIQRRLPAP